MFPDSDDYIVVMQESVENMHREFKTHWDIISAAYSKNCIDLGGRENDKVNVFTCHQSGNLRKGQTGVHCTILEIFLST